MTDIKALEWEEVHQARSLEDPNTELQGWEAMTGFGCGYYIEIRDGRFRLTDHLYGETTFEDPDEAKAAAQSDYEARIRSALVERKAEPLEHVEKVSTEAAMSQWERSLKRPDLCEKDRVRGAVEAYKRQAFDGWQPIETAPKDGTEVLCFGEYYGNPVRFVAVWNSAQWYAGWGSSIQPTHWQHLPPSPKPAAVSEGGEDE